MSYTAPSAHTIELVANWLQAHKVFHAVHHDWITINTTVGAANRLLDASFGWFEHTAVEPGQMKLRCLAYSIPDELAEHIKTIQPTTRFGNIAPLVSTLLSVTEFHNETTGNNFTTGNCGDYEAPACIKEALRMTSMSEPNSTGSVGSVGFAIFNSQAARYGDLRDWTSMVAPYVCADNLNFSIVEVNGGGGGCIPMTAVWSTAVSPEHPHVLRVLISPRCIDLLQTKMNLKKFVQSREILM